MKSPRIVFLVVVVVVAIGSRSAIADGGRTATTSIASIVEQVERNVVAISMERITDIPKPNEFKRKRFPGLSDEDFRDLNDYFKRPPGPVSGLLLNQEGHVLTSNYNVSKKVKDIRVQLGDGTELPAEIVARAAHDDLALLKITSGVPESFPVHPISWAGAPKLRSGRFVLAIGKSPDPKRTTMTLGIISSPTRYFNRLFQTDAALNYGNIGGPLVDLEGNVLGIAAFVGPHFPHWGFNSGIGFGVRADRIREVLPMLKRGEEPVIENSPFVGIGGGADRSRVGVRIGRVLPNRAAAAAGIKTDDVLIEWEGIQLYDFEQLRFLISKRKPGDEITLKVKRGEDTIELKLTLGRRELRAAP